MHPLTLIALLISTLLWQRQSLMASLCISQSWHNMFVHIPAEHWHTACGLYSSSFTIETILKSWQIWIHGTQNEACFSENNGACFISVGQLISSISHIGDFREIIFSSNQSKFQAICATPRHCPILMKLNRKCFWYKRNDIGNVEVNQTIFLFLVGNWCTLD